MEHDGWGEWSGHASGVTPGWRQYRATTPWHKHDKSALHIVKKIMTICLLTELPSGNSVPLYTHPHSQHKQVTLRVLLRARSGASGLDYAAKISYYLILYSIFPPEGQLSWRGGITATVAKTCAHACSALWCIISTFCFSSRALYKNWRNMARFVVRHVARYS